MVRSARAVSLLYTLWFSYSSFINNQSFKLASFEQSASIDKPSSSAIVYGNCTVNHYYPCFHDLISFKNIANGCGPLHYIADALPSVTSTKRKNITEFLIKKRALINEKNNDGFTPLALALENNNLEVAEILLKSKADINILDKMGMNPLHRMVQKGHYDAVQLLISYDVDLNAPTSQGLIAEQLAANESIKKFLMNYKLIGNNPTYKLLEAAKNGNISVVKAILEIEPNLVNCRDLEGRHSTPLHFASGYNHPEVVKLLLDAGADTQARDKGGLVPLHNACSYGHYAVAELLIKNGAHVNVSDIWKFSPLHEGINFEFY